MNLQEKHTNLKNIIKSYGNLAVAFSGGVDSTFLLKTAHDVLGENAIAVTARSCSFPLRELNEAKNFCENNKIKHVICESEELHIEGFAQNPVNRCYLCKSELFDKIKQAAQPFNINNIAEGSNLDDNGDYRPGLKAVKEHGVKSPLREANLNKAEIRELSRELNLPTWNKQSFACLSSRFVYGEQISEEKLGMVEKAEQLLLDLGLTQVRVRIHANENKAKIARIEVKPEESIKILNNAERINKEFKIYGFNYVTLDLGGYRTGSMNETLTQDEIKLGRNV